MSILDSIGVYGNFYAKRAAIALIGIGANPPEDAVYPLAQADDRGEPLLGDNDYVIHFDEDQLPPHRLAAIRATWPLQQ